MSVLGLLATVPSSQPNCFPPQRAQSPPPQVSSISYKGTNQAVDGTPPEQLQRQHMHGAQQKQHFQQQLQQNVQQHLQPQHIQHQHDLQQQQELQQHQLQQHDHVQQHQQQ